MSSAQSLVFLSTYSMCVRSSSGLLEMIFRPGAPGVIAKVRAPARFHLLVFFRRFRSHRRRHFFHRQWGASRTIGRVSDGTLSLSDF